MATRNPTTRTAATIKMIRPEDQQPKLCVAEIDESRLAEFENAGWVQKTDAEIADIEKARAPKPTAEEAAPEVKAEQPAAVDPQV